MRPTVKNRGKKILPMTTIGKESLYQPRSSHTTHKGGDAILKKISPEAIKYILYSGYDNLLEKAQRWHRVTGCHSSYSKYTECLTGYLGPRIHTFFYLNNPEFRQVSIDDVAAAATSWPPRESLLSKEDLELMQIPV